METTQKQLTILNPLTKKKKKGKLWNSYSNSKLRLDFTQYNEHQVMFKTLFWTSTIYKIDFDNVHACNFIQIY